MTALLINVMHLREIFEPDTLAHSDPSFIHQHVVDAFSAQTISASDKPIKLTFALVGLYLHIEEALTGKQVQEAHMRLARYKRPRQIDKVQNGCANKPGYDSVTDRIASRSAVVAE